LSVVVCPDHGCGKVIDVVCPTGTGIIMLGARHARIDRLVRDNVWKQQKRGCKCMDMKDFNKSIIEEFRANNGVVGGQFEGAPLLILTTKGARTGLVRENPLAYITDDGRYIVIASYAGGPRNPPWYYNLLANPEAAVEVGSERFNAKAEAVDEPERSRLYKAMEDKMPAFTEYRNKTSRVIPVIALTPEDA